MRLALFDLDETLIDGDCSTLWGLFMHRLGWADPQFIATEHAMMRRYAEGILSMEEYMRFTLAPLIDRTPQDVAGQTARFIETVIQPIVRAAGRRCIEAHRRRGDRLIIISASGAHLVEPIADCLGIEETLSIDLEVRNGRYTGRTQGILTYREGKAARLRHLLNGDVQPLTDAWFYSDSANDLPLLQQVGSPQAVNPDETLLLHARQAGWPVLRW